MQAVREQLAEVGSDVVHLLQQLADRFADIDTDVLWGLLAESARDPELFALIRSELLGDVHRGPVAVLVGRAVDRGEVDPSRLTERRIALPLDLMRNEVLVRGSITAESIAEIVDEVFLPLLCPGAARPAAEGA
ncbi:TetR-like C-terminal domain-containing protein [Streptomyces phytophilus]|uniref:TetR-like C-terminal domain-containing protein n=1 Tax=Streptomyces phytophilus TaxID=722715 RepID=UPI0015EFF95A|nr:TetR-like C-terminal domain-containing protein [Streptomyces phytophilus]